MRYQHIIEAVYGQPWLITAQAWYGIHEIVLNRVLNGKELPKATDVEGRRPVRDVFGDPIDRMEMITGVAGSAPIARIPIKGVMIKGAGLLDKMCGACSHEDVYEDLQEAMKQGARAIILDFNSPGGQVLGTPELAKHIAEIAKVAPVYAYTETMRASCAEYIAAGCTGLFATESAYIGSIGVIWETRNVARELEAAGIDYHVFTSGKFKSLGHPGKPMPEEHAEWIQANVDALGAQFRGHMTTYRKIAQKDMEGQPIRGSDGVRAGLIDATVRNFQEVLDFVR
jgi:capsid assembly protease